VSSRFRRHLAVNRRSLSESELQATILFTVLLSFQHVVLIDPSAAKEAVAHHLLAKQKNEACQDGQKEKLYYP
jgi:hypothetical protein